MKCPRCRIHDLVVIEMKVGSERVVLRSCSSCNLREWEGLDGRLPLGAVLGLVGQG